MNGGARPDRASGGHDSGGAGFLDGQEASSGAVLAVGDPVRSGRRWSAPSRGPTPGPSSAGRAGRLTAPNRFQFSPGRLNSHKTRKNEFPNVSAGFPTRATRRDGGAMTATGSVASGGSALWRLWPGPFGRPENGAPRAARIRFIFPAGA